jgi:hypothetical protein
MIQKPISDDVIRTPLKVGGPALPGAQDWNPTSLKGSEGVGRSQGGHPLADDDGPGPGPRIEPRGIDRHTAVVEGVWCANGYVWPFEHTGLPHFVVFRGNRANGEGNHVDGQGELPSTSMIRFAAHSTAYASNP